jgi:hypothetical protein
MGSEPNDEVLAKLFGQERDLLHRISGTPWEASGARAALLTKLKAVRADIARRVAAHEDAPKLHDTK